MQHAHTHIVVCAHMMQGAEATGTRERAASPAVFTGGKRCPLFLQARSEAKNGAGCEPRCHCPPADRHRGLCVYGAYRGQAIPDLLVAFATCVHRPTAESRGGSACIRGGAKAGRGRGGRTGRGRGRPHLSGVAVRDGRSGPRHAGDRSGGGAGRGRGSSLRGGGSVHVAGWLNSLPLPQPQP